MDKSYRIYLSEVCLYYMVFMVRYSYDQMTRMFPTLYCRTWLFYTGIFVFYLFSREGKFYSIQSYGFLKPHSLIGYRLSNMIKLSEPSFIEWCEINYAKRGGKYWQRLSRWWITHIKLVYLHTHRSFFHS